MSEYDLRFFTRQQNGEDNGSHYVLRDDKENAAQKRLETLERKKETLYRKKETLKTDQHPPQNGFDSF